MDELEARASAVSSWLSQLEALSQQARLPPATRCESASLSAACRRAGRVLSALGG